MVSEPEFQETLFDLTPEQKKAEYAAQVQKARNRLYGAIEAKTQAIEKNRSRPTADGY